MTDNEIIKALKCCVFTQSCAFDEDKFYCHHGYSKFCDKALLDDALSLINRQEAEIERLNNAYKQCAFERDAYIEIQNTAVAEAKAEAYKEFAEKSEKEIFIKQDNERKQMLEILKTYRGTRTYSDTERATDNWLRGYGEAVQDILSINDNLLKELEGENDEQTKKND